MTIYINVLNVNDNAPVFSQSVYLAEIFENSTVGTSAQQISASDVESGKAYSRWDLHIVLSILVLCSLLPIA